MLLEETVKKLSPMQSLLALKDFPHTSAYEPCGEVTLAPVLNEARGSTSGSFRWSRRSVRRSPRQICTALLSVVAFVAVTLYYFRACHGWARNGNVPRRLAGQMPSSGEDPMLSFILDMCLDMEEESGSTPQRQMAAAGHREAHLPAGHEQGPPESTSNQYPWDWDDPPFYYPSQAPHSEPAYRQVDDHGLQRGASAVWGGADVQEEEPATFSGHFPVTQPCIGMPPPAAAEEGTSGLDISMSSPHQFRPSAGSSTHACLHLSPGVDPDVKTPGLAVPIDPSVNPQQLLIGSSLPQSSLLHAPPHRAAVAQKRPFAPVESSGLLSVNNPSKRLRAENSPTLGLSDTVASQGVLLEPTVELGQRLVLRPIQAVPSEMLPHSLEHSALGRGSSSGMVNIQVASWPKKKWEPGRFSAGSWRIASQILGAYPVFTFCMYG